MEWTTAASFTARTSINAFKHRFFLQEWWKKALAHFDIGSTEILVTGRPNVGKTILVKQLEGSARQVNFELPNESFTVENDAVRFGNKTKLLRTLPGQTSLVRLKGINTTFHENTNLIGIIHTVDFGFTIPRDSTIRKSLLEESNINTIQKLREYNLVNEIDELLKLTTNIEQSIVRQQSPKWLLIAVNKTDLYKDELDDALDFYHPLGKSAFSRELQRMQANIGKNHFPIYVAATCSHKENFIWNKETCHSGFHLNEQEKLLLDFNKLVTKILEKKYD